MPEDNGDRPPLWPEPDEAAVAAAHDRSPNAELHRITFGPEVMIVRTPSRGEYGRFRNAVWDDQKRGPALEMLLRDCVVYPDRTLFATLLERWPPLAERLGNELLRLSRAQDDLRSEKL